MNQLSKNKSHLEVAPHEKLIPNTTKSFTKFTEFYSYLQLQNYPNDLNQEISGSSTILKRFDDSNN